MNSRLEVRLHRAAQAPATTAAKPLAAAVVPPLRLLGEGHDAILVRYRGRVPQSPSAEERLLRYVRALYCRDITTAEARVADVRRCIGEQFQLAWARGLRPNLRHGLPGLRIRTHSSLRTT